VVVHNQNLGLFRVGVVHRKISLSLTGGASKILERRVSTC